MDTFTSPTTAFSVQLAFFLLAIVHSGDEGAQVQPGAMPATVPTVTSANFCTVRKVDGILVLL